MDPYPLKCIYVIMDCGVPNGVTDAIFIFCLLKMVFDNCIY